MEIFLFIAGSLVAGYSFRLICEKIKKPKPKDATDVLLDEVDMCGEVVKVEIVEVRYYDLKQIELSSGIILRKGKYGYNDWNVRPCIFVGGIILGLTEKQEYRVDALVEKKQAEFGSQQITNKLLTE